MSFQNEADWAVAGQQLVTGLKVEGIALEDFQRALEAPWFIPHVLDAVKIANSMTPALSLILTDEKLQLIADRTVLSESVSRIRPFVVSGEALQVLSPEQILLLHETEFNPAKSFYLADCAVNRSEEEIKKLWTITSTISAEVKRLYIQHQATVAEEAGDTRTIADPKLRKALGERIHNILARSEVKYFAALTEWTEDDLLDLCNFGDGSLKTVKRVLKKENLRLKPRE